MTLTLGELLLFAGFAAHDKSPTDEHRKHLIALGLITEKHELTTRGRAHLKQLIAAELPRAAWVDSKGERLE